MIFGSQSHPKQLRYTHTWATFIKATGEGHDPNAYALEVHTISWLPATLEVRVLRPWPEPGVNLDLYQTLRVVYANGESVTMWGPFLVGQEVYRQVALGPGHRQRRPAYRAISTPAEPARQRLHPRRRGRRPRLRPRALPADPHRQAGLPVHRAQIMTAHPREGHRAGAVRQLLADPAAGAGSLPDRGHPAPADPPALRPVPVPGLDAPAVREADLRCTTPPSTADGAGLRRRPRVGRASRESPSRHAGHGRTIPPGTGSLRGPRGGGAGREYSSPCGQTLPPRERPCRPRGVRGCRFRLQLTGET